MCGRYFIAEDVSMSRVLANLPQQQELKLGEIYPTNYAPVILPRGEISLSYWGFPRFDGKGVIINARSETVPEKKTFISPLKDGRCLIPASWYFEWQNNNGKKIKHAFLSSTEPIIYLVGISRIDRGTGERSFTILTRQATDHIAHIHQRMPVILPTSAHDEWLHGTKYGETISKAVTNVEYRAV